MPNQRRPKTWREMSVDFRLMFVYHGGMMVLFMTGRSLSVRAEIAIALALAAVLTVISVRHRKITHWRWPGVSPRDILFSVLTVAGIVFFLFSTTTLFPPSDSRFLPWYLAGLGIGVFGVLSNLKIVYQSEAEFLAHCRTIDQYGREIEPAPEAQEAKDVEIRWKRVVRGVYTVTFMLLWVGGVAFFYFFGTSFRNGSPVPTASQSEPLTDHGKTVFTTRAEKQRIDRLQAVSWGGIPLVLLSGVILHFIVGVKLFPNTPTLSEYRARKNGI